MREWLSATKAIQSRLIDEIKYAWMSEPCWIQILLDTLQWPLAAQCHVTCNMMGLCSSWRCLMLCLSMLCTYSRTNRVVLHRQYLEWCWKPSATFNKPASILSVTTFQKAFLRDRLSVAQLGHCWVLSYSKEGTLSSTSCFDIVYSWSFGVSFGMMRQYH